MSLKKLSALIIGVGSIGVRHLRSFQSTGLYSVAACDPNPDLGRTIGTRYNCPAFSSLDEALAQGSHDVAVICTPANLHTSFALACVSRGMHVLIEKPLALTLDKLPELEAVAAEKERVIRVAYTLRSIPVFQAMKELLLSEKLGSIHHVSVVTGHDFPQARPAYRTIYYNKHETGGGAIQDALTHQIHLVEWFVGPIDRLFAHAAHYALEGVDVEDTVNVTALTNSQTAISLALNQFQAPTESTIQVNGMLGSARLEYHNNRLGTFYRGDTSWTWTEYPLEERDTAFVRQALYLRDEMSGIPSPLCNLAEGIQTLKVNRAALQSAKTHMEVVIK